MARWIINAPRWLFLAALVYAPWAYGTTRPWTITGLNWLLGATIAAWLVSYVMQQRWPRFNRVQLLATAFLIGQAWFMVFNARFDYDRVNYQFMERSPWLSFAPGSLDYALSFGTAIRLTLLLLAGLVVSEMAEHPAWRKRMLGTMLLTGCSIVALGLAQRFTGATDIFWARKDLGPNFFATFRNHTNAGAFLNLIWPLAIAFAAREKLKAGPAWRIALWSVLAVLCLTGVMVNTSRAASALAAGLMFLTGIWLVWQTIRGRFGTTTPATLAATSLLLVVVIGALAFLTGLDSNLGRWRQLDKQWTGDNSRLLAARACLKMIPESGWWGFGPGTFETAFPYFTAEYGNRLRGRWIFAHQDYLQTLTEWGYAGGCGWAVLTGGAMLHSWRRRRSGRQGVKDTARATHFGIQIALASVFLHALVDFPLQIASIQLYTVTLLGILWSARHWMKSPHRHHVSKHSAVREDALAAAA